MGKWKQADAAVALFVLGLSPMLAVAGPTEVKRPGEIRVELRANGAPQTSRQARAELKATFAPPSKPSPTHVCKRADLDTQPLHAAGGEVFVKGACDAGTAGPHAQWPLPAPFQITPNVERDAVDACEREWTRRGRAGAGRSPFTFASPFKGKIHIRYCFLDMQPTVDGNGTQHWGVDCGQDGIDVTHIVDVPLSVTCVPGDALHSPPPYAARPVLLPAPGSYETAQSVQITTSSPNAQVFYRAYRRGQSGGDPVLYQGPVSVTGCGFIIEAFARGEAYRDSLKAVGAYDIEPPVAAGQKRATGKGAVGCARPKEDGRAKRPPEERREKARDRPREERRTPRPPNRQ